MRLAASAVGSSLLVPLVAVPALAPAWLPVAVFFASAFETGLLALFLYKVVRFGSARFFLRTTRAEGEDDDLVEEAAAGRVPTTKNAANAIQLATVFQEFALFTMQM